MSFLHHEICTQTSLKFEELFEEQKANQTAPSIALRIPEATQQLFIHGARALGLSSERSLGADGVGTHMTEQKRQKSASEARTDPPGAALVSIPSTPAALSYTFLKSLYNGIK